MLMFCYLLPAVLFAGQQWVGVSSQSPLPSTITVSGSVQTSTEISVEIPGFYLQEAFFEGKICQFPRIPDGHPILAIGSPDLQKLSFTLKLPANGNMDVSIASEKYIEYTDIDIIPSAGDGERNGNSISLLKGISYSTDAFFPGKLIDSEQPFIVRNERSQSFHVFPFQYNPVTRVLRFYYMLIFNVTNTGGEGVNPLTENDFNMKPIEGIKAHNINGESNSLKSGQLPSDRGSMLIICPEQYMAAITPLAEWRKQTGITTEVVNAGKFASAEELYTFVKGFYYTNSNLAYLLLVGDARQVPSFIYPHGASDNYYSYLAGNDHYPDILVGRFSAESAKDVEVQVNRTLQYEKVPGIDAAWITNVTGIGSTLSPGDDGESDFQHIRKLLKNLKTTTYTQSNEFFDGSQGEADAEGNPSAADIAGKINQGTGVLFYAGHGSPSSMATGSVSKSVVESLNNNGKYPLIWAAACETGNFTDKYCIAESWLRASNSSGQPTGAVAALMASGTQTSYPPMEAQDKIAELMSNPQEGMSTMGAISVKGMMSMNDVYGSAGFATTDTWILFGDPSLRVRTSSPKEITATHKKAIGKGRDSFSFTCNASEGLACLSNQGIILGTAQLSGGSATIYLDQPVSCENITLTITALNYLPYIATLEVLSIPGNPELCFPLNHSKLQPINSSFSWECSEGGIPEYYLFYLGTDNPPTNLINGQKLTATQIKTLTNFKYDTDYFWKVEPVNSFGNAKGKIMTFSTVFAPDEDFEPVFKSRVQWSDGGAQRWENDGIQYFDGMQSIRSGQVNNNEFSALAYPCEVTNCDFVSFWSKTSSATEDILQFMIDGITVEEWSGITEWSFHSYKVEPGLHQLEWRYAKDREGSAGEDAAWLDNIHLPLHAPLSINANESGSICEGSVFETSVTAENYFTINWQTEGDGSFEDNNLENAAYNPGSLDAQNGLALLKMKLTGFEGCPSINKTLQLTISPLPIITLPADTIISIGSTVELDAGLNGNMTYNWQPCGSSSASVIIDSSSSVNGTKTASVTVTSQLGCAATKDIRIHFNNSALADSYKIFPNPSNGNFTIEPVKGSALVDNMMLIDREGKVVWESDENCDIVGSKQISITGLSGGSYFLVIGNNNGRAVNKVVIQ